MPSLKITAANSAPGIGHSSDTNPAAPAIRMLRRDLDMLNHSMYQAALSWNAIVGR